MPLVARNARYLRRLLGRRRIGAPAPRGCAGLLQLLVILLQRRPPPRRMPHGAVVGRQAVDDQRRVDLQREGHEERAHERDQACRRGEPLRRAIHRLIEPVVDFGDEVALGGVEDRHVLPHRRRQLGGGALQLQRHRADVLQRRLRIGDAVVVERRGQRRSFRRAAAQLPAPAAAAIRSLVNSSRCTTLPSRRRRQGGGLS